MIERKLGLRSGIQEPLRDAFRLSLLYLRVNAAFLAYDHFVFLAWHIHRRELSEIVLFQSSMDALLELGIIRDDRPDICYDPRSAFSRAWAYSFDLTHR